MTTPARGFAAFRLDDALMADEHTPVLVVQGELDLFTSRDFRARLLERVGEAKDDVVVDFSHSTFLDSSACAALIHGGRRLQASRRRLVIVNQDPAIARIFAIMGLDELFAVVGSRAEASVALRR